MVGIKSIIHVGQRLLHQLMVQAVRIVKADLRAGQRLDLRQGVLRLSPQRGMYQIVLRSEADVLVVKNDVLQHALHVIAVNPVQAVHIHVCNGGSSVPHLEVA